MTNYSSLLRDLGLISEEQLSRNNEGPLISLSHPLWTTGPTCLKHCIIPGEAEDSSSRDCNGDTFLKPPLSAWASDQITRGVPPISLLMDSPVQGAFCSKARSPTAQSEFPPTLLFKHGALILMGNALELKTDQYSLRSTQMGQHKRSAADSASATCVKMRIFTWSKYLKELKAVCGGSRGIWKLRHPKHTEPGPPSDYRKSHPEAGLVVQKHLICYI